MSGFDKDWLTLREPADRQARSPRLVETLNRHLRSEPAPRAIMDIGCGTGSTYRTLSSALPQSRWKLVDYEAALLEEARHQLDMKQEIEFHRQDLNRLDETLLDDVAIVTASALFDLCSADFCDRFLARLSAKKIGLYAALNYDGVMEWSIKHPLDDDLVRDFNRHQQSDKGFGPALGPDATDYLLSTGERLGFLCETASSPWHLDAQSEPLQRQFLDGLRAPIEEIGTISAASFTEWLEFRRSNIGIGGSLCVVGHTDFLALPRM